MKKLAVLAVLAALLSGCATHHTVMQCDEPTGGHFKCEYWEKG